MISADQLELVRNNDSLVNASGNQIPLQACNNDIPINVGTIAGQIPVSAPRADGTAR